MFLIRSAKVSDLKGVVVLARHLNSYNLPADRAAVARLLRDSERAFKGQRLSDDHKKFLFVAEEVPGGRIVGTSLIIARHGTPRLPHISFRRKGRTLKLLVSRRGFTEIGGLAVLPRYRGHAEKIGKQLSYARFAFMARRRGTFRPKVLVEYLPPLEPGTGKGNALWDAVGARFTGLSYAQADRLSAVSKEFILALFPKKISAGLLPKKAQKVLGLPGKGAQKSIVMLKKIGFRSLGQIDPFDGGPHYGADLARIALVLRTAQKRFKQSAILGKKAAKAIVMTDKKGKVRACVSPCLAAKGTVLLPRQTVRLLRLKPGDAVSLTPF